MPPWAHMATTLTTGAAPTDARRIVVRAPARRRRRRRWRAAVTPTSIVTFGLVALAVLFTLAQLRPRLLLTGTTPAGGDMGAHVWGPAYLRDVLLPAGKLSGWTADWYAGFPAYQFYMVIPSLLIVALDLVLPYGVAFKLVTVLGVLTLPIAAWAFGRLARLPFPGPALLAIATVPFLFERTFTIYGGNIASTLAGEFAFSISLSLAVLFAGVVIRGLEDGRHRAWAAGLLALCALCHLIPAVFALTAAVVAFAVFRPGRAGLRWMAPVLVVGGAITSFWTLPFLLRRAYMNDMGWEKLHKYWEYLLPGSVGRGATRLLGGAANAEADGLLGNGDMTVVILLALAGVVLAFLLQRRVGIYVALLGLVFAVAFVAVPQGRLWNARLLPFWYLCLYFLAGLALTEVARGVARFVVPGRREPPWPVLAVTGLSLALVVIAGVAFPLRALPNGSTGADGVYSWLGLRTTDRSFIPAWAQWNYSGYERKAKYPEYQAVVDTMRDLGTTNGCGRAMWEYYPELDQYGTPMALMLLPYWTDGCIDSMEGLYFEASATTPYHFLNQALLSAVPSRAQRNLPYGTLDVAKGVDRLQLMGVRYYMATSATAIAGADANPDLTPVATSGPWHIYEVAGADLVTPLANEPAVVQGMDDGGHAWLDPSVAWYEDDAAHDVFLAADGPPEWQRVTDPADVSPLAVPAAQVSDIRADEDSISFSVDRPGSPVLVKTSYFPNWEVEGALGPWRVTPNFMVVVPTGTEVRLHYATTSVEWVGWAVTLLGLVGLVVLARSRPVRMPDVPRRGRPPAEISAELQSGIDSYLASLEIPPEPGLDPDPDHLPDGDAGPDVPARPPAG